MRKILLGLATCVLAVLVLIQAPAWASDFFSVFKINPVYTAGTNAQVNANVYGVRLLLNWNDINMNRDFDANERLNGVAVLFDRSGKAVLATPTNVVTRHQLQAWAVANAKEILDVLFPAGGSTAVGVSDDAQLGYPLFRNVLFKKVTPASKKTPKDESGQLQVMGNDVKADLEYSILRVDDNDGYALATTLGYQHVFASGAELGVLVPYRYTSMDDSGNSVGNFLGFDIYLKYPVMKRAKTNWYVGADLVGSALYLNADTIEHYGYLKYGGGVFTSVDHDCDLFTVSLGLDYKLTKSYFPRVFKSNNDFLNEALKWINDMDPVQTLSYGVNIGVPLNENFALNVECIRSNFFSKDIENNRSSQTVVGASITWAPTASFDLNLGVRQTYELKNIDDTTIMLGAIYRF